MPATQLQLALAPLSDPPHRALSRLGRRLAQVPDTAWSPPPLPELIARIDGALAARRGAEAGA